MATFLFLNIFEISPFSGERGAILLLFPYLWWPLKFFIYAYYISRYLNPPSRMRSYGLSLVRIALGVASTVGLVVLLQGSKLALFSIPLLSIFSWYLVYLILKVRDEPGRPIPFIAKGFLISLLLNLVSLAVTGVFGIGC